MSIITPKPGFFPKPFPAWHKFAISQTCTSLNKPTRACDIIIFSKAYPCDLGPWLATACHGFTGPPLAHVENTHMWRICWQQEVKNVRQYYSSVVCPIPGNSGCMLAPGSIHPSCTSAAGIHLQVSCPGFPALSAITPGTFVLCANPPGDLQPVSGLQPQLILSQGCCCCSLHACRP